MKRHLQSETFVRAFLVASILILGPTWVTVSTYAQGSALPDAVEQQDRALINRLLDERTDVNATQVDGMSSLHWAVYQSLWSSKCINSYFNFINGKFIHCLSLMDSNIHRMREHHSAVVEAENTQQNESKHGNQWRMTTYQKPLIYSVKFLAMFRFQRRMI